MFQISLLGDKNLIKFPDFWCGAIVVISKSSDSIEGVWYPKEKIRQAKKKLQGYNPAHVMLTELTLGHEKTAEYPALKIILMGDKKYSKRAQVSL